MPESLQMQPGRELDLAGELVSDNTNLVGVERLIVHLTFSLGWQLIRYKFGTMHAHEQSPFETACIRHM